MYSLPAKSLKEMGTFHDFIGKCIKPVKSLRWMPHLPWCCEKVLPDTRSAIGELVVSGEPWGTLDKLDK